MTISTTVVQTFGTSAPASRSQRGIVLRGAQSPRRLGRAGIPAGPDGEGQAASEARPGNAANLAARCSLGWVVSDYSSSGPVVRAAD